MSSIKRKKTTFFYDIGSIALEDATTIATHIDNLSSQIF
jgi:hypothetical protein